MTKREIAQLFSKSLTTVDRWVLRGLRVTQDGRNTSIDPEDVRRFLRRRSGTVYLDDPGDPENEKTVGEAMADLLSNMSVFRFVMSVNEDLGIALDEQMYRFFESKPTELIQIENTVADTIDGLK